MSDNINSDAQSTLPMNTSQQVEPEYNVCVGCPVASAHTYVDADTGLECRENCPTSPEGQAYRRRMKACPYTNRGKNVKKVEKKKVRVGQKKQVKKGR